MHWVLQHDLYHEPGMVELARVLQRADIPFSEHKVVPFTGEIEPDINPSGSVIVFGSYAMKHVARRKGWQPGCYDVGTVSFRDCLERWHGHMLNADAVFASLGDAGPTIDPFFIRPSADTKSFTGKLMRLGDFGAWRRRTIELGSDHRRGPSADTEIFWCAPKNIQRECRLWIVGGVVVTASQYRVGERVAYSPMVDEDAVKFGSAMAAQWAPAEAFVLDVCLDEDRWKIVEINTLNTAGLYAADVSKLVQALELASENR